MPKNQVEFDLEVAELLVATNIVLSYNLDRVHAAIRGGPGLREALIEARAVDVATWDAAAVIVDLIRQGKLPKDQGRTALNMTGTTGMSVSEALAKMGYSAAPENPWEKKLKELSESGKYKAAN